MSLPCPVVAVVAATVNPPLVMVGLFARVVGGSTVRVTAPFTTP